MTKKKLYIIFASTLALIISFIIASIIITNNFNRE